MIRISRGFPQDGGHFSGPRLGRGAADRTAVGLSWSSQIRPTRSARSEGHPPLPEPRYQDPKIGGPLIASSTRFWAGSWPSIWPTCYAPWGSSSQHSACGGPTRRGRPDRHGPRASRRGPSPEIQATKVGATTVQEGRTLIFGLAFPIRATHILGREPADRAALGLRGSYPMRRKRSA